MRAMGIDPGTAICGFGIVDSDGSRLKPVTYGTVQTTADRSDADRLETIYTSLHELYRKYTPDIIGVEQPFFNRNVTTAITGGLQVKQGVTGYGRATKEQVTQMTMQLLGIREKIKPDDAADALAMAIYTVYAAHSRRLHREVQL